jgi:predicted amidohydrolase
LLVILQRHTKLAVTNVARTRREVNELGNSVQKVSTPFKVAAVEFNPEMFEFNKNVQRAVAIIEEAAAAGARLIVLPEAALSGYIYRDLEQFLPYMDSVPGKGTSAIEPVCKKYNCYVAIGIAEVDPATSMTYNTGALIGPDGYIGKYRKVGLNPSDILWFVPGNTGHPVFETELGNITMAICYDDTYWEPARIPAVKGADIMVYICSSDRVLTELGPEAKADHSTIAAVEQFSAWNGLAMVAADRNNAESNPTTGISVVYGGSASIWQADGTRIAHAPATDANTTFTNPGQILYGEINPALFDNSQKRTLQRRRPELYGDVAFFKAPTDGAATTASQSVALTALQYQVIAGDVDGNINRALEQVTAAVNAGVSGGLVVFPSYSITGKPTSAEQLSAWAEADLGKTTQVLGDYAIHLKSFVVGSHIESSEGKYYHAAVLLSPEGKIIGRYRQTHLDENAIAGLTAGDDLTVFETSIGRIGILLGEDVRFPEASGVLALRRADFIAVPTSWGGEYGAYLKDAKGLFAHGYPVNTVNFWYAVAKTSQAYTVVANSVGNGQQGSSGVFTLNPVDAFPPVVGSTDNPGVVNLVVESLGKPDWWMNQSKLVGGRRADLAVPLRLKMDSPEFLAWKNSPGFDTTSWTSFVQ